MERAADSCFMWIVTNFSRKTPVKIFCGKGNNGGDGLAIARLLSRHDRPVSVFIAGNKKAGSPDFEINLGRIKKTVKIFFIEDEKSFPVLSKDDLIIDALFGTGLNKKPTGLISNLIKYINLNSAVVVSIDVPSGLYVDKTSSGNEVIKATYTLTFQNPKLAFLLPENHCFTGKVILLDIELSKEFEEKENTPFTFTDAKLIAKIYRPRNEFSNKGNFGYAGLLAGSYGMMGAAVLSARGCLRSGVGKLTCYTCEAGYTILQVAVPEAMCKVFGDKFLKGTPNYNDFDVIGIGPGIGKYESHQQLLQNLFSDFKKPLVIDADALNILSEHPGLYSSIPANSILTPHPKEFERLFGKTETDFDRVQLALSKAKELKIFIVLKGHYTFIASPDGRGFFNSTGNAGMATAGAGDVLTGILTGLLAQHYSSLDACILGVYLHGLAGDIASKSTSQESLIADDIIENLGNAFKEVSEYPRKEES